MTDDEIARRQSDDEAAREEARRRQGQAMNDAAFVLQFNRTVHEVHVNARRKGFWDRKPSLPELIALTHSELSEMLEAHRKGLTKSTKIPAFTAEEEELADVVIRAMDIAGGLKMRLAEAIVAKIAFNDAREHMHGKRL